MDLRSDKRVWQRRPRAPAATATIAVATLLALLAVAGGARATPSPAPTPAPAGASLSELQTQANEIERQIDRLDMRLEVVVEEYNAARLRLDAVNAELTQVRIQLAGRESTLASQQQLLAQRLAWMYKMGEYTLFDVLANSGSFADAESQLEFYRRLGEEDQETQDEYSRLVREIDDLETTLDARRSEALAAEGLVDQKRAVVEDQLAQRQAILDNLDSRIETILKRRAAFSAAEAARLARIAGVDLRSVTGSVAQIACVRATLRYLGVPYVWGGASPGGFDCSGLVMYVMKDFGVSLPHFAAYQANLGKPVPYGQLQPADLVFFGRPIHHVGMYVGGGLFVHAPHTGDVVKVTRLSTYEMPSACCRYSLRMH